MQQISSKNSELFDQYLTDFQVDIRRIVGKFKKSFHSLSDQEVYSECNLHIFKNKEKILSTFDEENEFTEAEFKKIAYHYCKNEAVWSHYRFTNQAYNKRKLDGVAETEDGPKSTFEVAVETMGQENQELDNDFDFFGEGARRFIHVLTEYSYLLNETEVKIISFIQKGWNQDKMAEHLDITRQAISFAFIQLKEKLNAYFDLNAILNSDTDGHISEGVDAMNDFFAPSTKKLSKEDKDNIQSLLVKNPNSYNLDQINEKLFNGQFLNQQIGHYIGRSKLKHLLSSKSELYNFSQEEKAKALKLFEEGKSTDEVSKVLGSPKIQVSCLRGYFVKNHKLKPLVEREDISQEDRSLVLNTFLELKDFHLVCEKLKDKFSSGQLRSMKAGFVRNNKLPRHFLKFTNDEKSKMLKLYKEGKNAREIAEAMGENVTSITPVIGSFYKNGQVDDTYKQRGNVFGSAITEEITNLFLDGKTSKEISDALDLNYMSVSGFRSSLTMKGIIKKAPRRIFKFNEDEANKIIKLREEGHTSKEIGKIMNKSSRSISSFLGSFTKKKNESLG